MPSMHSALGVLFLYLALVNMVSATTGHSGDGTCDIMTDRVEQENDTYVGERASCCGEVLFQFDTQMCCNETVYDGVTDQECCGKDRFNVKYEVCPSNKSMVHGDLKLCANDYYHSGFRKCCGRNTYPVDDHVQCCGVHVHDTRTSTCIDGKIVDLLMECCGSSTMNSRHQLCCDSGSGEYFPVDKSEPDDDRCCRTDGRTYSSVTHHCGPEGVERRHLLISLCGRQAYDPVRDICCDGFVYRGGKTRRLKCQDIIRFNVYLTSLE
ncbi:Galaxin [Mizuhopecten yessoensis]|uniref:Galaxin n=1 Tax=Mizuhopecten yessoensis TaxID=6573 RepID=A0A210PDM4_MIZYE|nr:Galaxin [Mizuhopecten yessoensis]